MRWLLKCGSNKPRELVSVVEPQVPEFLTSPLGTVIYNRMKTKIPGIFLLQSQ